LYVGETLTDTGYVGESPTYNYGVVRKNTGIDIGGWVSDTVTWSVIDAGGANNGRK
jgi:hypothetical protein